MKTRNRLVAFNCGRRIAESLLEDSSTDPLNYGVAQMACIQLKGHLENPLKVG